MSIRSIYVPVSMLCLGASLIGCAMQFVLERTKQEAVRKHIEALGIPDYQAIISKGLNSQVIEWKGIEATVP
jgi:hypothetical protein